MASNLIINLKLNPIFHFCLIALCNKVREKEDKVRTWVVFMMYFSDNKVDGCRVVIGIMIAGIKRQGKQLNIILPPSFNVYQSINKCCSPGEWLSAVAHDKCNALTFSTSSLNFKHFSTEGWGWRLVWFRHLLLLKLQAFSASLESYGYSSIYSYTIVLSKCKEFLIVPMNQWQQIILHNLAFCHHRIWGYEDDEDHKTTL